MSEFVGTKIVRVLGSASLADRTIISAGVSATILGIYVSRVTNATPDFINIQDADGNAITDIAVYGYGHSSITTPFIINNGLLVVSNAPTGSQRLLSRITIIYRLNT